jgi:hypothetical protein
MRVGGILGITVMVVVADTGLPDLLLAVSVYMVVVVGVAVVEPEAATAPTPGDILTLLAFVVFQVSTAVSPASIEDLLTLKEFMTGDGVGAGVGDGIIIPGMSGG